MTKKSSVAPRFVVLVGVMSFFADFTYVGSGTVVGQYLGLLGGGPAIALAIDIMLPTLRDEFDIATICSSDADLEPALRAVLDQTWKNVEVLAWRNPSRSSMRLDLANERVRCHWLDKPAYEKCLDLTDYSKVVSGDQTKDQ